MANSYRSGESSPLDYNYLLITDIFLICIKLVLYPPSQLSFSDLSSVSTRKVLKFIEIDKYILIYLPKCLCNSGLYMVYN